jgi:hypothetical protein
MFIVGAILPVVMIILVLTVMPESPRWLVQKNREKEAKEILQKIYPDGYNVDPVICDIKEALEREEAAELSGLGNNHVFNTSIPSHVAGRVGTAVRSR